MGWWVAGWRASRRLRLKQSDAMLLLLLLLLLLPRNPRTLLTQGLRNARLDREPRPQQMRTRQEQGQPWLGRVQGHNPVGTRCRASFRRHPHQVFRL